MLYFYPGDEYFLFCDLGDLAIENNVGGFNKEESCTIAKSLLG